MLNCFGMSRYTQIKANDKTIAIMKAQTVFEYIKSSKNSNEMDDILKSIFTSSSYNQNNNQHIYVDYYDKDWNKCLVEKKVYFITLEVSNVEISTGDMNDIKVTVKKVKPYPFIDKVKDSSIISFETRKFFPKFLIGRQQNV